MFTNIDALGINEKVETIQKRTSVEIVKMKKNNFLILSDQTKIEKVQKV